MSEKLQAFRKGSKVGLFGKHLDAHVAHELASKYSREMRCAIELRDADGTVHAVYDIHQNRRKEGP